MKCYDKAYTPWGNVLRAAETTLNNVGVFRAYRPKEGGPEEDRKWRTLRKGVADLHRRTEISQKTNEQLIHALASVDDSRTLTELTGALQAPVFYHGRRVRALQPLGKDRSLLQAIKEGELLIHGFRNRDLQNRLYATAPESPQERRRRSAAISRKLRMLRVHGLIHKVPRTHRYQVAPEARVILLTVLTATRTSLRQINALTTAA